MKLYYAPGACSQAPHILLHEADFPHESEAVDLRAHTTASGADYYAINPKGPVPALDLGDDGVLTENAAILQYIGDKSGKDSLFPGSGTDRYRVIEWVSFIATELHKSFSPLFNPALSDEVKSGVKDRIAAKFDDAERMLGAKPFTGGEQMTIADPYLFVMTRWADGHGIDLSRWPALSAFRARMMERPAVQTVLKAEGLA